MTKSLIASGLAVCLSVCVLMAGATSLATQPAATATSTAPGTWAVAYRLDLSKAAQLGPEWLAADGTAAEIADGALVIRPGQVPVGECQLPGLGVGGIVRCILPEGAPSVVTKTFRDDAGGATNRKSLCWGGSSTATPTSFLRLGRQFNCRPKHDLAHGVCGLHYFRFRQA